MHDVSVYRQVYVAVKYKSFVCINVNLNLSKKCDLCQNNEACNVNVAQTA